MKKINNRFLIYNLIPLNIAFDILSYWTPGRGWLGLIRAFVMFSILLFFYTKNDFPKNSASNRIVLFSLYVVFLFPFVTNLSESARISFQVILSIFFYTVGYKLINGITDLNKLNNSIVFSIVLLILNFIASNLFGLGNYKYVGQSSDFYLGNYRDAINIFVYILFILPILYFQLKKKQPIILYFFAIFLILIILFSTKRIAAAVMAIGLLILLFNVKRFLIKSIFRVILIIIIMLMISPFFMESLTNRWQTRIEAGRLETESYETEARFLETIVVIEETFGFESLSKSLFGLEAFNSPGLYAGGKFGGRQLHVDYNLILSTTGIIGLILYVLIYINIYINYKSYRRELKFNSIYGSILNAIFYMLFFGSLVTSIAGQMYGISFRGLIFLYLGGLTGLLKSFVKQKSLGDENINRL